ncbi:leucine-rich repeat protein [Candidatus Palauibacter sp.]|uniref:leucine-rich repeat domain-containing protein n=1 Tax=Candidatus Palauibacter sp. TaxID=3101350 RepID=UPI003CC53B96
MLILSWAMACGDAAGPEPEPNRPPRAVGRISDLLLPAGETATVDVSEQFDDPEQGALRYQAATSNGTVVSVSASGSVVTMTAITAGTATIVVTATDPGGLVAQQAFAVAVPAPPVVELAGSVAPIPESGTAVVDLVLSAPAPTPITVSYTLGVDDDPGTADASPEDLADGTSGTVEIRAGIAEASIEIQVADDDDIEPTREAFTLTLDAPAADAGYELGPLKRVVLEIAEGVCDRTPMIAGAIVSEAGVESCVAVEDSHLDGIVRLAFGLGQSVESWLASFDRPQAGECVGEGWFSTGEADHPRGPGESAECEAGPATTVSNGPMAGTASTRNANTTTLRSRDFAGLRRLSLLILANSGLAELPPGVFAGLESLEQLFLIQNRISTLPPALFSDLGRLTTLVLTDNRLDALPEDAFSGLSSLELLFLDANQIGALPAGLSRLANLRILVSSKNRLTELPAGVSDLANLEVLWLDRNRLTSLPAEIPAGLQSLVLSFNELTELPAGSLQAASGLADLRLDNNQLATLPTGAFSGLTNLSTLYLWSNRLRELPDGVFADLESLSRLLLAGNELTTLPPDAFSGLSNLAWLTLDSNKLAELPGDVFADLPGLQRLWVSGNELETLPAGIFTPLQDLEFLALAENEIADLPAGTFAGLSKLSTLFLLKNQLAELPADLFSGLSSLKRLYVSENQLNDLPAGLFSGLNRLEQLSLEDNPGAPFEFAVQVERADSDDLLAPSPGSVTARLAQGAPFAMRIPLSAHGGQLADEAVVIGAGEETGSAVAVTRDEGSQTGAQVSAGPAPVNPYGFTGFTIALSDPLVLFGELSNRAPFALRAIPWQRLRAGTGGPTFAASSHFRDPDGDELAYEVANDDPGVATVTVVESRIMVAPEAGGTTMVLVTASDPAGLSAGLSFAVHVRDPIPGSYDIDVVFADSISEPQRAVFQEAADWWMAILADMELPDMPTGEVGRLGCGDIFADVSIGTIDELVVVASVREVDGPRGVLAAAQPCGVREESMLPFLGVVMVDVDDLDSLEAEDQRELILHEMGHVLGIGSLWTDFGLLQNPSLQLGGDADTHFSGPLAIAAFDDAGGTVYTEGEKVPVENRAGPGSGDSHWRQSVLRTELMTPFASLGTPDPLSAITIQSLADLGYMVDVSLAEPYTLPGAADAAAGEIDLIDLGDDVLKSPIVVFDRNGRVAGVIGG